MTKSLNVLAFAAVFGVLAALPEAAQGVTINGCSSPSWDPNTSTLTCSGGGSGPPSCTITGSVNGTTGVVDNLTANCSPAATSYSWAGGSCASGSSQICAANEATTGLKTYTVTGTNASGPGSASPGYNVTWYSTSGPPQGCAITPANQSLGSVGGAITQLTVACAGGAQPLTSFTWTHSGAGCGASFTPSSTKNQGETLPANTTTGSLACQYNVTVDNGSGSPAVATAATATVAGTGGTISCSGFSSTIVQTIPWVNDSGLVPTGKGSLAAFADGVAYVGIINVPAGAKPQPTVGGHIAIFEYAGPLTRRWVTLSPTPCNWVSASDGTNYSYYDNEPSIIFSVGPNAAHVPALTPGQTYYLNIQSKDPQSGVAQCGSASCNMNTEFWKPSGS